MKHEVDVDDFTRYNPVNNNISYYILLNYNISCHIAGYDFTTSTETLHLASTRPFSKQYSINSANYSNELHLTAPDDGEQSDRYHGRIVFRSKYKIV